MRKDIVNKALLDLPKRENLDILKMCIEMSKAKEAYSMTEIESAYFAYEWISQNIEYDCYGKNLGNATTEPVTTYKEGKGGDIGIAALFNIICGLLNIKSNTISGLTKVRTQNFKHLIDIRDYSWNFIFIDNKYYLIDLVMGSGVCYGNTFYKKQKDFYFGINPEASIRYHFPYDNKWQLLDEIISLDEFYSMALLQEDFYILGFKAIDPDVQTFKNVGDEVIKFTYDNSNDDIKFSAMNDVDFEDLPIDLVISNVKTSKGATKFKCPIIGTGYIDIFATNTTSGKNFYLATYEIN